MTYQNLLEILQTLTLEQLKMNVSVYDVVTDEYYPCYSFGISPEDDNSDSNKPYLVFK